MIVTSAKLLRPFGRRKRKTAISFMWCEQNELPRAAFAEASSWVWVAAQERLCNNGMRSGAERFRCREAR
jgi:hypothetical protein